MRRIVHAATVVALAGAILACGGGGGSTRSSTPVAVTPVPLQPTITITSTGLLVGFLNQPYGDTVQATVSSGGGSSIVAQGNLPPGLLFAGGVVQGTPTQVGNFPVTFVATSTLIPSLTTSKVLNIQIVSTGTVRNDTLGSATPLICCGNLRASLSPYSKASGVVAPDQDYYRFTANAGERISVDTFAIGTEIDTDTVIEILDVNGARMNACKTPQATTAFNQACLNDDISQGVVRGSHLDVQLAASSGVFIVHVLDWGGRARPEMTYELRTAKLP